MLKHQTLRHRYYFDPVYKVNYIFILNVRTNKQLEVLLKKKYPTTYRFYKEQVTKWGKEDCSVENCGGRTYTNDTKGRILITVVYNKNNTEADFYSILSHECFHAVSGVFNHRGVEYNPTLHANQEHFTYYLESLIRAALTKEKK